MIFKKIWAYLNIFGKNKSNDKKNLNLKMMHGINRISILMFLVGAIVIIIKLLF